VDPVARCNEPIVGGQNRTLMQMSGRVDCHDGCMPKEPGHGAIRQTHMDNVLPRLRLLGASGLLLVCAACGGAPNVTGSSGGKVTSYANGTSSAHCVGPYLSDQPPSGPFRGPVPTVSPGATITIYGHWYTSTCNDTGGNDPLVPLPPVHLTITLPGGDVQELGEFHPSGKDMGFSSGVHVPAATRVGTATVRDDQQHPAIYKFKVGQ
jgi:hypothetical protein